MANEDEDIPPLEDMSDLLEKISNIRDMKYNEETIVSDNTNKTATKTVGEASSSPTLSTSSCVSSSNSTVTPTSLSQAKSNTFGGFKKGFLLSSKPANNKPQSTKSTLPTQATGDMPVIRPSAEATIQERCIPEVQEAMKSGVPLLDSKEWITEDLLKHIQSNPSLASKLMDPKFSKALAHMQSNPQEAFEMLQGDADMQEALQQFCGLMGQHFTSLSNQQTEQKPRQKLTQEQAIGLVERTSTKPTTEATSNKPSPEEEEQMKTILSRPDVKLALQDEQIQKIIGLLRTNPDAAQRELQQATPSLRSKLKILMDAGLLALA